MGSASANIKMVRENLALAIAFWAAAQSGVITASNVPARTVFKTLAKDFVEVDTPLELTDSRELVRCVSNQIRGAFAFSAIQTHRVLETIYKGTPLEEKDPNLRAARCSFYILNKSMTRNLMYPVWICPSEYRGRYDVQDVPFVLDAAKLEGKEVFWDDFGGLQPYMGLLEFCRLRVAEDSAPPASEPEPAAAVDQVVLPPSANGKVAKVSDISDFVDDRCYVGADAKSIAKDLYQGYVDWCYRRGEQPLPQRTFGMQLSRQGFQRQRRGKGRHWWLGLGLHAQSPAANGNGLILS